MVMSDLKNPSFKVSRCASCANPKSKCSLSYRAIVEDSLAVYIVEDHNEVLPYIYRAIGSKTLPFSGGAILHFDSHPDLMIPSKFDSSRILDKEYVFSSLSIENWMMPAVFAKHFTAIGWIKPFWSNQLFDGLHHFKIGCHQLSKEIKVTCPQAYFVGELTWAKESDLEQISDVILDVLTLRINSENTCEAEKTEDQLVSEGSTPACKKLKKVTKENGLSDSFKNAIYHVPYVLDIDLDFFSTCNPFLEMFTSEPLKILSDLCHYEHPTDETDDASLKEATQKRQKQITELETVFTKMNDPSYTNTECNNFQIEQLFEALKSNGCTTDPELLLSAGCTCKDCALPHHVSSRKEICDFVQVTEEFLRTLPKPSIVTVSRSSLDGYCPSEDVDFVQQAVLNMLKRLYNSIDFHHDYEDCNSTK